MSKDKIIPCRTYHAGSSTCPGCRSDFDFEKQRFLTDRELKADAEGLEGKVLTRTQKLKRCVGCRNNFYNGNNSLGVSECWSLKDAEVVWKKEVSVDQRPPWDQKAQQFLSCFRRPRYVYVQPDQTH